MMEKDILLRTSHGVSLVPMSSMALEKRTIYVEREIDDTLAMDFIQQVVYLNQEDEKKPIKVLIMSAGGSIIHGLAMYDAICTSKAPIETYCIGAAYSMAAILFVAGNRRCMLEHSKLMLHEPLITNNMVSSASSIKSLSDSMQETKEKINSILCKHTNQSMKDMEIATGFDHYFSAEEAIGFGLADEVVGIEQII